MKELFVSLKTTDASAQTALKALKRMGHNLPDLKRFDYYAFDTNDETLKSLKECDIIVNANKHSVNTEIPNNKINILITDNDKPTSLLKTLERLGFNNIQDLKKGVVWSFDTDDKELATNMAKALLFSPHYQSLTLL